MTWACHPALLWLVQLGHPVSPLYNHRHSRHGRSPSAIGARFRLSYVLCPGDDDSCCLLSDRFGTVTDDGTSVALISLTSFTVGVSFNG